MVMIICLGLSGVDTGVLFAEIGTTGTREDVWYLWLLRVD